MASGPVSIASKICVLVDWVSGGANFPLVSAPPAPSKLWHCAQSVMNRLCPSAVFAPVVLTSAADGMAGPPPSMATYAASA